MVRKRYHGSAQTVLNPQYGQRQQDINKAQGEYLIRLSRVLCCDIDLLMEWV